MYRTHFIILASLFLVTCFPVFVMSNARAANLLSFDRLSFAKGSALQDNGAGVLVRHLNYYDPGVKFTGIPVKAGGYYRFRSEVNGTSEHRDAFYAQVFFAAKKEKYQSESIEILRNQVAVKVDFIFQVPKDLVEKQIELWLFSRVRGKGIICRNMSLEEIPRPPESKITLLSPTYRNSIYHSHPVAEIAGEAVFFPPPAKTKVSLLSGDKLLASLEGRTFSFAGAAQLEDGTYMVRAEAFDNKGNLLAHTEEKIYKLPPSAMEVVIGNDNNFYINGKLFLPVMFFSSNLSPALRQTAASHGVNLSVIYESDPAVILQCLDIAMANGYRLILYLPYDGGTDGVSNLAEYEQRMRPRLQPDILAHPALFGYFLKDEPAIKGEPLKPLQDAATFLRLSDPYRPIFLNEAPHGAVQQHKMYSAMADVYGMDIYPVGRWNHGSIGDVRSLTCVGSAIECCVAGVENRKPIIGVLQAFAWNKFDPVYPDQTQSRFMLYDAWFNGMKIPAYYTPSSVSSREFMTVLFNIVEEINAMKIIFSCGQITYRNFSEPVRSMTIEHDGQQYLIAANYTDTVVEAKLPVSFSNDRLNVWFEDRTVSVQEGSIYESFTPFAVHVYTNAALKNLDKIPAPENWYQHADQLRASIANEKAQLVYWIDPPKGEKFAKMDSACFLRQFEISSPLAQAVLVAASTKPAEIFCDGKVIAKLPGDRQPVRLDVLDELALGKNNLGVRVLTGGKGGNSIAVELHIRHFSGEISIIPSNDKWVFIKMNGDNAPPAFDYSLPQAVSLYRLERGLRGKNITWPQTGIK
jgi:hypothetical protein